MPEGALDAFDLALGEGVTVTSGGDVALVNAKNALFLRVGDVSALPAGVWTGLVDDNIGSPGNWKNLTVPAAETAIDFTAISSAKTLTVDADFKSGTVTFNSAITSSNAVSFTINAGKTLSLPAVVSGVGAVTVAAGATFETRGTVALGGALTLADGANLGFVLAGETAGSPFVIAQIVTAADGAEVTVKADCDGMRLGRDYVLVAFDPDSSTVNDETTFAADSSLENKAEISCGEGRLVLRAVPFFTIRIADL